MKLFKFLPALLVAITLSAGAYAADTSMTGKPASAGKHATARHAHHASTDAEKKCMKEHPRNKAAYAKCVKEGAASAPAAMPMMPATSTAPDNTEAPAAH